MKKAKGKYYQGVYKLVNRDKYLGDPDKITFRSSWELKCMNHFDKTKSVIKWNSEGVIIPYISPKDGKYHRYFMDFLIVTKDEANPSGKKIILIEVKPKAQTIPPKAKGKRKSRFLSEALTFEVNSAKWKATREYCKGKGWEFIIMTEDHIF